MNIVNGMTYFENLKQDIQEYFGSKGDISEQRTGLIKDLSSPESIGLFFCISTKAELSDIRNLLRIARERRDPVVAYVFSHTRERIDVITDKSIVYFDLNDFTLFGKKKDSIKNIFEKDRPELLISFITTDDPFCLKLVSEVHAEFKVGPGTEGADKIYNMVMDMEDEAFNYKGFYEQVRNYLSVLNIKTR